jgi:hypothetical protein
VWGFFSKGANSKRQTDPAGQPPPLQHEQQAQQQQQQQQQQQPAYTRMAGPVVVVFETAAPEALDPALLALLPARLLLELPSAEGREELLLARLMEGDAAVGVSDLERLVR